MAKTSLGDAVLTVDDLAVRYRNGALGIDGVSLRVASGQVVALLGPNGAGKTTTVRGITGFLRAEGARIIRGTVQFGGRQIAGAEPHVPSSLGVAFIPERQKVFANLSVAENLTVRGKLPDPQVTAQLYEEIWSLFPVLAERRRTLAGRLSGGQQQMLAIARAILSDPALLIIDEMTLGLHPSLHSPLFEAVSQIAGRGTAIVIVDESTEFALEASDYCYLISSGKVRREGPSVEFSADDIASSYVHAR